MFLQDFVAALNVGLGPLRVRGRGDVKEGIALVRVAFPGDADDNSLELAVNGGLVSSERVGDQSEFTARDDGFAQFDQRYDQATLIRPHPRGAIREDGPCRRLERFAEPRQHPQMSHHGIDAAQAVTDRVGGNSERFPAFKKQRGDAEISQKVSKRAFAKSRLDNDGWLERFCQLRRDRVTRRDSYLREVGATDSTSVEINRMGAPGDHFLDKGKGETRTE